MPKIRLNSNALYSFMGETDLDLNESTIAFEDVTGTTVYFSSEQVDYLIRLLKPEQQRYAKILARTINQPHEIWQSLANDGSGHDKTRKIRTYLQYLDLSNADVDAPFGVSMAQFVHRTRWELQGFDIYTGEQDEVIERISGTIGTGSMEYSITQH